ncbi:MAG: ATP-grasp domain-containing protein [Chromatiaceae bacterium]|nr:ATP-grasp domain-containing protein [Chromatiaceae bacterium]
MTTDTVQPPAQPSGSDARRVLVIGPRRALIDHLRARGIPFSVWREHAGFSLADAQQVLTAPFWNTTEKLKRTIAEAFGDTRYSHVIAATEGAVYPAALARRLLGARLSPATTALRCRDKLAMKEYLAEFDIPMTDFMAESAAPSAGDVFARLGTPVVRKRRKSSGGRELSFVRREQDLVLQKDGRNILERFVSAPEASIESFVNGGQIRFVNTTRYVEKRHVNFVPADLDEAVLSAMLELNRRVLRALKINWGITHLEVYLTEAGLLFGEIALRPPGGYIMNAMRHAYGFDPWAAFVAMELNESFAFPQGPSGYACVEVLHPGSGRVTEVRGEQLVREHPATREFRLKVVVGDVIGERQGAGEDVGYLLHLSPSPAARLALLDEFHRNLSIRLEEQSV